MSKKQCVVPEGMLKAAHEANFSLDAPVRQIVEAALRWQSENPIVPTQEQYEELHKKWRYDGITKASSAIEFQRICRAWQRQMHLAPEPEVPEDIKDLLMGSAYTPMTGMVELNPEWDKRIIEAYRRGQASKESSVVNLGKPQYLLERGRV
jgi:hypothetical protein